MSTMKTEPCAFCKKNVVSPCESTIVSATCSQFIKPGTVVTNTPRVTDTPEQLLARAARLERPDPLAELSTRAGLTPPAKPTDVQVGGDHYKTMAIQPLTFIQANDIGFEEGNIIKYVSRWRKKNGIQDLEKARDMLDKKIAFEKAKEAAGLMDYLSGLFKSV